MAFQQRAKLSEFEVVNPLQIDAWDEYLIARGDGDFFHSRAWAETLYNSYGYEPIYFVRRENERLTFLMPFMEVTSILTGRRGVSLPFTDQCPILSDDPDYLESAIRQLLLYGRERHWKYVKWNGPSTFLARVAPASINYAHEIDLTQPSDKLWSGFADNTRRNIRKAIKLGVTAEISSTAESLESFCRLNRMTRRRHGIPPQPNCFFAQVLSNVLSRGKGCIVSARWRNRIAAAAMFFHFGDCVVYKYGASDESLHCLKVNNLLMYRAIEYFKNKGYKLLHLGKTERQHEGLLRYKRGWGADERDLLYYRYNYRDDAFVANPGRMDPLAIFRRLPLWIASMVSKLLYGHFA